MAFIEKYLIYILLAVIVIVSVLGGIQYVRVLKAKDTITKQAGQITDLKKTNADLQGQISDYKANIAAIQKAQAEQQAVAYVTASLQAKVQKITSKCEVNEDDEKTIDSVTNDFNNAGVLLPEQANSSSKAGAESLSQANPPGIGSPGKQRYTLNQIIENYLNLINYTLQLEKTEACYESVNGIP